MDIHVKLCCFAILVLWLATRLVTQVNSDVCESSICLNGGTCTENGTTYQCICMHGYEGQNCENTSPTHHCSLMDDPCPTSRRCEPRGEYYVCSCHEGFTGEFCDFWLEPCLSSPCVQNATCQHRESTEYRFDCICPLGYEGSNCSLEIDECASHPCMHGGTCHDALASYACTCTPGYTGSTCEIEVYECSSEPCRNGGQCLDHIGYYTCACTEGHQGVSCEEETACVSQPCQNGGVCSPQSDSFTCQCHATYTGELCEYEFHPCESVPCVNGATCYEQGVEYVCSCAQGFQGIICEEDIDDCEISPCLSGAACVDEINGVTCQCPANTLGSFCAPNPCTLNPCNYLGECRIVDSGANVEAALRYRAFCLCVNSFTGQECESGPCEVYGFENGNTYCHNFGECVNLIQEDALGRLYGDRVCHCEDGFTGRRCLSGTAEILHSCFVIHLSSIGYYFAAIFILNP